MLTPYLSALRTSALLSLSCLFAGCGPVVIGAALSGGGGGGGGGGESGFQVTASPIRSYMQPALSATELRFSAAQTTGRRAKARLLVAAGDDPTFRPIPAVLLSSGSSGLEILDTSTDGWTMEFASANEPLLTVSWNHAAQFGNREVRNVSLRLEFADADEPSTFVGSADLLTNHPGVGVQVGRLSNVTWALASQNRESNIVVRATLTDVAADFDATRFDVRYVVEGVVGQSNTPMSVERRVEPPSGSATDPVVLDIVGEIDAVAAGLPFGQFAEFGVEIGLREVFDSGSRFPTSLSEAGQNARSETRPLTFGIPPAILTVAPVRNDPLDGDPQSRPRVPINVTIRNGSSRRAIRVELEGFYTAAGGGSREVATLVQTDAAPTATVLRIGAGETRAHRVLWDVAADRGLGVLAPANRPNDWVLADVALRATVIPDSGGFGGVGTSFVVEQSSAAGSGTILSTAPFLDEPAVVLLDDDELGDGVAQFATAVDPASGRTGGAYFTTNAAGRNLIGLSQEASAIAVRGVEPFDIRDDPSLSGLGLQGGYDRLIPTDIDPAYPDCVTRVRGSGGDNWFHVVWRPGINQTEVPKPMFERMTLDGSQSISVPGGINVVPQLQPFDVGAAQLGNRANRDGFFLFTYDLPNGSTREHRIHLSVVYRDGLNGPWRVVTDAPTTTLPTEAVFNAEPVGAGGFVGEFDGDPDTQDYVFGFSGSEFRSSSELGWMHMARVRYDRGANEPQLLPILPIPAPPALSRPRVNDPSLAIAAWQIAPLPHPTLVDRTGIVLSRRIDGSLGSRTFDVHVLKQNEAAGGFVGQTWQRVLRVRAGDPASGEDFGLPIDTDLAHGDAFDFDGGLGLGGDPQPELFIGFTAKRTTSEAFNRRYVCLVRPGIHDQLAPGDRWRTVVDYSLAGAEYDRIESVRLLDADGDRYIDVALNAVRSGNVVRKSSWSFLRSAFAAPALTATMPLDTGNPITRSPRPVVADLNEDGYADIVTSGGLYTGSRQGRFDLALANGIAGSPRWEYAVGNVLDHGQPDGDSVQLIAYDPFATTMMPLGFVQTLNGLRSNSPSLAGQRMPLRVESNRPIRNIVPIVADEDAAEKTLATVAFFGGFHRLYRLTRNGNEFVSGSGWLEPPITDRLATVRTKTLTGEPDPLRNRILQDVAVASGNSNTVYVMDARTGYQQQKTMRIGTQSTRAIDLAGASVTDDGLEDLMVLTVTGRDVEVWCYVQGAMSGIRPGTEKLVTRFRLAAGERALGLGFDDRATERAVGMVLTTERIELIFPEGGVGSVTQLPARTLRSDYFATLPFSPMETLSTELLTSDADGDGILEVMVGDPRIALQKINFGYRAR